ncbi:DUF4129 domain-containing protein [Halorarius halobius]|uniref:DUF4129 domain-containing protein n=1 Tax=Halorarius halobius TaxID=2962671 RepID=UPI0020CF04E1|nr:DUF4129 domain-containing protein [Halorarius halobius]
MDRSRIVVALLALLAVVSISVAAATLNDTAGGSGGIGAGDTEDPGLGEGSFGIDLSPPTINDAGAPGWLAVWLGRLLLLFVVLASLYAFYQLYREYGPRGVAFAVVSAVVFAALVFLLFGTGEGGMAPGLSDSDRNNTSIVPGGGVPGNADTSVPAADPPTVLAVLFALALVGAGVVLVRATGDDEFTPEPEAVPAGEEDVEAVGRVAGEAADRIARGSVVDNEIFRAWREMTDHLAVDNPEASTPSEFAAAAVDAGMAREDVEALTALFEEVRYGDAPVTDEREQEAVDALRRIEEGYA